MYLVQYVLSETLAMTGMVVMTVLWEMIVLVVLAVLVVLMVHVGLVWESTDRCAIRKASRKKSVEKRSARPTIPETWPQEMTACGETEQ